jgi:hypothetical protein
MAPQPTPLPIVSVYDRASQNLDFIRRTMERASAFTAVPGKGLITNGLIALIAAWQLGSSAPPDERLRVWLACAALGFVVGVGTMWHKASTAGVALLSGPGRRFLVALLPPFCAAAVLTIALVRANLHDLLPGAWLLLYGVGVLTGGAFAIRPVVVMGGCFFVLGAAAVLAPAHLGNAFMAVGFGFLQLAFGAVITRRYGG